MRIQSIGGTCQRPVNDVTDAMSGLFHCCHLIFAGVTEQHLGQSLPFGYCEAKTQEKCRLASAGRMRRTEQIMRDLRLGHGC